MSTVTPLNHHIQEITDNFFMITLPMPLRLGQVNIYLIVHDKEVTLFDTGLNMNGTLPEIEDSLASMGLSIGNIRHIFLTHSHADHCGVAGLIKERSGAVIHISDAGRRHIERMKDGDLIVRRMRDFLSWQGLPEKTINFMAKMFGHFKKVTIPFEVDEILQPNTLYETCGRIFQPISTPGHANGHTCFYFDNEGILISGDHVLPDITPNLSPDLFDTNFHPLGAFISSLDTVRRLPVTMICPAHGEPFADLKGRVDEIKNHHRERKDLILNAIGTEWKNVFQITLEVFGDNLSELDKFLATNEVYIHIIELLEEGTVKKDCSGKHALYAIS